MALITLSRDKSQAFLQSIRQGLSVQHDKKPKCEIIYLDGFQQIDHIGAEAPPVRSILTFSSPFLFLMLTMPLNIPKARYWPSLVQLIKHTHTEEQTTENKQQGGRMVHTLQWGWQK